MKNVLFARPLRRAMMTAALCPALALTACSQADNEETGMATDTAATAEVADAANAAAPDAAAIPGLDPTAIPGVAFVFRFAFRLADDQIAEAQDRHLRACERIGRERCQVTSVVFERKGDDPVNAHIAFLIDPALARGFARDATQVVDALDGETLSSSVTGEELARGIEDSQAHSALLGGDLARIERRLSQPGLSGRERAELAQQAANLRGEMRGSERERRDREVRLASTPVRFDYSGNTGIAGLDRTRPFASAWAASSESLGSAAAFALMLAGILLPWLLMIGGAVWLVRLVLRRTRRQSDGSAASAG